MFTARRGEQQTYRKLHEYSRKHCGEVTVKRKENSHCQFRLQLTDVLSFFPKAMSTGTELAFTAAVGGATVGLTLSTPLGWVALGVAGVFGFFGAVAVIAHEDGKTQRKRIERRYAANKR